MSASRSRSSSPTMPARAEDALEAIALDIESLPAVADRAAAARKDVLLFEETGTNCALTLSGDPRRRRRGFRARAVHAARAFPRAPPYRGSDGNARPAGRMGRARGEADGLRREQSAVSQPPHARRADRDLSVDAIEMVESDVGGAFGVRGEFYPEDFLIPFAARSSAAR